MSSIQEFINTISTTIFFGAALTLICFSIGLIVQKKFKLKILNPIIISVAMIIIILNIADISYDTYNNGAQLISIFLTPATVCLAVPLYEKLQLLKDNLLAVLGGIMAGIAANLMLIWGVCVAFNLDKTIFATMAPKSITTAIGMVLSEETGGIVNITVAMIVITGNTGYLFAETIIRLFKIKSPVAKGIAIGNSTHVLGTSKAVELGEVEGAMSGLAVAVAGILTVIVVPLVLGV